MASTLLSCGRVCLTCHSYVRSSYDSTFSRAITEGLPQSVLYFSLSQLLWGIFASITAGATMTTATMAQHSIYQLSSNFSTSTLAVCFSSAVLKMNLRMC